MPKCTINGQEVEVKDGATIIEAFAQTGTGIAHYCWHPGLSVAGVCRMCMVEIQGMPKLQIACNTKVTEGMVISNQSEKVKDAVKWTLDFHLINHPLDCPICDQAGECGLQEQYMRFGKYDPEMSERKVKKRKVVDLGPTVVLDSERCILCSRCVRFTSEVSKTHELGIFNRGDHSEIGTFEDKPLKNDYSLNTVDICPVGALTSKEFRFQQRVWFLKEHETVCTQCSTGCNMKVSYNKVAVFRAKPVYNPEVNGYWMCDQGRDVEHVNRENRLTRAVRVVGGRKSTLAAGAAAKEAYQLIADQIASNGKESVVVVLTAQYTVEELEAMVQRFGKMGVGQIVWWNNHPEKAEEFDGLLLRGDRNPNTKGLQEVFKEAGLKDSADWRAAVQDPKVKTVVVAGPEVQKHFDLKELASLCATKEEIVWLTANPVQELENARATVYQIPVKSFLEKTGTFVNFEGRRQTVEAGPVLVSEALTLQQAADLLTGQEVTWIPAPALRQQGRIYNELEKESGQI